MSFKVGDLIKTVEGWIGEVKTVADHLIVKFEHGEQAVSHEAATVVTDVKADAKAVEAKV